MYHISLGFFFHCTISEMSLHLLIDEVSYHIWQLFLELHEEIVLLEFSDVLQI